MFNTKRITYLIYVGVLLLIQLYLPTTHASNIWERSVGWINGEQGPTIETLSIVEISEMRVRDITRRLSRQHGYGADEIARMIDKKDLINALSYEEHRVEQKEAKRKKRVALRRSIIIALICIIFVMFRPLFIHAWEVLCVNVEVYIDKKKYEISRVIELKSIKGIVGLFLILIMDALQTWLTISVILSWVMKSKYFFPVPYIPIKPAALLATASGNTGNVGPLGNYGLNIGPALISWGFRYINSRLEHFIGKAMADAMKRQRKKAKAAQKAARKEEERQAKEERKTARRARRAEREAREKDMTSKAPISSSSQSVSERNDERIQERRSTDDELIQETNKSKDVTHQTPFGSMDGLD